MYLITIYSSSSGEPIKFKFFDGNEVTELDQMVEFVTNGNKGSVV